MRPRYNRRASHSTVGPDTRHVTKRYMELKYRVPEYRNCWGVHQQIILPYLRVHPGNDWRYIDLHKGRISFQTCRVRLTRDKHARRTPLTGCKTPVPWDGRGLLRIKIYDFAIYANPNQLSRPSKLTHSD
jgi:hypothetical protein